MRQVLEALRSANNEIQDLRKGIHNAISKVSGFTVGSYGSACGIFTGAGFGPVRKWDRFTVTHNAPPVCNAAFILIIRIAAPYGYYGPDYFVNGVFIGGLDRGANFYYSHAAFYQPYYFNHWLWRARRIPR